MTGYHQAHVWVVHRRHGSRGGMPAAVLWWRAATVVELTADRVTVRYDDTGEVAELTLPVGESVGATAVRRVAAQRQRGRLTTEGGSDE